MNYEEYAMKNRTVWFMGLFLLLAGYHNTVSAKHVQLSEHDFAIKPNDGQDQTGSIQSYLNHIAQNGGGIAYLAPGRYRLDSSITVPTGVTLTGSWSIP